MKNTLKYFLPSLILIIFLGSCKKEKQRSPAFTGPANKEAVSVTLANGQIKLDIPAGAMPEGTQVTMESSDAAFPDAPSVLKQFELLPAGTKFNKPVTLTLQYNPDMLKGNSPNNIGIAFQNDNDGQWYAPIKGVIDTVNHTISVKITHFSHWAYFSCLHLYTKVNGQLYRDNDLTPPMLTNDVAELCLVMDLPPLSAEDADVQKMLQQVGKILHQDPVNPSAFQDCADCALLGPIVYNPPVTTDDIKNKIIEPDKWTVNGVTNGNSKTGVVSSLIKNSFLYTAPAKMPLDNPIAIAAVINTKSHGQLQIVQQVNVYARKWRFTFAENYTEECDGYDFDVYGFKTSMKSTVEFSFQNSFALSDVSYSNSPWSVSNIQNCSPNLTDLNIAPESTIALNLWGLKKGDNFLDNAEYGYLFLNMNAMYNGNFKVSAISHYNDGSGYTEPFNQTWHTGNEFIDDYGILIPNVPREELGDKNSKQIIEAIE